MGLLNRSSVRVELYADTLGGVLPFRQEMDCHEDRTSERGTLLYAASVPAVRIANDYTARIIPAHPNLSVPLEAPLVLWQR